MKPRFRQKTVDLSEQALERLTAAAERRGVSVPELIRRLVDYGLDAFESGTATAPSGHFPTSREAPPQHRESTAEPAMEPSEHRQSTVRAPSEHRNGTEEGGIGGGVEGRRERTDNEEATTTGEDSTPLEVSTPPHLVGRAIAAGALGPPPQALALARPGSLAARGDPALLDALSRLLDNEPGALEAANASLPRNGQRVLLPEVPPKRRRRTSPDAPLPDIPAALECPGFRRAWELRLKERAEKGSKSRLTPSQVASQFRKLTGLATACGLGAAIGAVEEATANGWQGVVFEKYFEAPPTPSEPPGPTPQEAARAEAFRLQGQLCELASTVLLCNDPRFETAMSLHDASLYGDLTVSEAMQANIDELGAVRVTMTAEEIAWTRSENAALRKAAFKPPDLSGVLL